jgi:protein-disulfide isomerase
MGRSFAVLACALAAMACGNSDAAAQPKAAATAQPAATQSAAAPSAAKSAGAGSASAGSAAAADPARELQTRADASRLLGADTAMWVVMISDFQCPYCRQWHDQSMANLRRDYIDKGTVRMVYLQFPLNTHRHAKAEAVASLCAGAQGRFWEYADSLFARQETVGKMTDVTPLLTRLGRDLRLDAGQFDACRRSPAIEALLQNDVQQALRAGVRSTPTFLIGDFLVEGAIPWTDFRRAVDTALVVARTRPRGGAGGPAQP